jgi:hypothetical protein
MTELELWSSTFRDATLPELAVAAADLHAWVAAAPPGLPVGAEVPSDEVDALGLAEGSRRVVRALRQVVGAANR